jgi:hypothetical protein
MSSLKHLYLSLSVLAMACTAEATSPALSLSLVPPATLRFSWSSNFVNWQLMSTPDLLPADWQAVTQAAVPSNNTFVVLFPFADKSGFFRLQQTNSSGGCVVQATPPVINSGGSSTLTWCPVAGEIYRLSPGLGVVTGGSASVSPTVTTVYTLTASNSMGITTNFTSVIVNPCGFASVSNWDATLTFSYTLAPSAPGYGFSINRRAQATFRLTPFGPGVFAFNGSASGIASINDREDDSSSGPLITSTTVGLGPPHPMLSTFVLGINCTSNAFNFSAIVAVDAIDTETYIGGSSSSPRTAIAGQVAILSHPLPFASSTISGSAVLPVVGPFTIPATDYFIPNDIIANDMWINGVITDPTAGTASVSWSFTPAP